MHYSNETPVKKHGPDATTRDIADRIDELITLRICEYHSRDTEDKSWLESIELKKRQIADALKQHSGATGICVSGDHP
jgi:hypothetical protein